MGTTYSPQASPGLVPEQRARSKLLSTARHADGKERQSAGGTEIESYRPTLNAVAWRTSNSDPWTRVGSNNSWVCPTPCYSSPMGQIIGLWTFVYCWDASGVQIDLGSMRAEKWGLWRWWWNISIWMEETRVQKPRLESGRWKLGSQFIKENNCMYIVIIITNGTC